MLACLERGNGLRGVMLIASQDEDRVHVGIAKQALIIRTAVVRAKALRIAQGPGTTRRAYGPQLDPLHLPDDWQVHPSRQVAGADERHAQGARWVCCGARPHGVVTDWAREPAPGGS